MSYKEEGSFGWGFVLGFFFSIIGLILALVIDKPETRRGAVAGFLTSFISIIFVGVCFICNFFGALSGKLDGMPEFIYVLFKFLN